MTERLRCRSMPTYSFSIGASLFVRVWCDNPSLDLETGTVTGSGGPAPSCHHLWARSTRPDTSTTLTDVVDPGPLLASGRDSDIFGYGPGLVLRRSREGRSMKQEAQVMDYVRGQGFPVPAVDEISPDGLDMVIERIEGPDMVAMIENRPWTIRQQGRTLAGLHRQLHDVTAPDWLSDAPVG